MPRNKTTSKKSPTKKSGRASKTTATPSKKKKALTPKPLIDFQATLPQDFYAPSVWEAHQAFRHPEAFPNFSRPVNLPNDKSWTHFLTFLQHLHLEDLCLALRESTLLLTHELVTEQLVHLSMMVTQAKSLERFLEHSLKEPFGIRWSEEDEPNWLITSRGKAQAQEALVVLNRALIEGVLPGYTVEKKKGRKYSDHRVLKELEWDSECDDGPIVPKSMNVVNTYIRMCKDLSVVFHNFPAVCDFANKKKFWKWARNESKKAFYQRIGKFIQAVHERTKLANKFDIVKLQDRKASAIEADYTLHLKRIRQSDFLKGQWMVTPPGDPTRVLFQVRELLAEFPPLSSEEEEKLARQWTHSTEVKSINRQPLSPEDLVDIIAYAHRGRSINVRYLIFAMCACYRMQEEPKSSIAKEATSIRGMFDRQAYDDFRPILSRLLYPPT